MDCPADHAEMLVKRLSRFRLRADVQIENTPFQVITGAEGRAVPETVLTSALDPRCEGTGWRAVVTEPAQGGETPAAFLERRLTLGLPDVMDFESEQTLALEADMDLLHGVSWKRAAIWGRNSPPAPITAASSSAVSSRCPVGGHIPQRGRRHRFRRT